MRHDTGWFGGSIVKKIGKTAKKAAKTVGKAAGGAAKIAAKAAPIAQSVIKNTPLGATPMGMAASGALGALRAVVRGDRLENVAWAAAEGAAPAGLERAIQAAHAIRRGDNVLKVALTSARSQFAPNTPALAGFDTAQRLLTSGATASAIDAARRALPNDVARQGFNAAIGTLSQKMQGVVNQRRPLGLRDPISAVQRAVGNAPRALTRAHPTLAMAQKALAKNPILSAAAPAVAARALNLPVRAVQDAQRSMRRPLKWRPSSLRAANFIRRYAAVPARALTLADTGALVAGANPPTWKIDSLVPYQVAQKLTGVSSRWKELLDPLNPGMTAYNQKNKDGSTVTLVKGWTIGKVIKLPPSWFPNLAPPAPTPTAPTSPSAVPVSLQSDMTATIKAKATLVAWSKTDGAQSTPFPDYGATITDTMPQWTERDGIVLHAFSKWWNASHPSQQVPLGSGPIASAVLTQAHADALHAWAESKAGMPLPQTPTAPTPTAPTPTAPTPPAATPATPTAPTMPTIPGIPTIPTFPPIPTMPPSGDLPPGAPVPGAPIPTSFPTAPAATEKKSEDGLGLALLAAGAALTLF
jgi:hypothetical protein